MKKLLLHFNKIAEYVVHFAAVIQALSIAVVAGLPVALIVAWAFELTPDGLKREKDVDRSQSITSKTDRKLNRLIIC